MLLRKVILVHIFCLLSCSCNELDQMENDNKTLNYTNENLFHFDKTEPLVAVGELGPLRVTHGFENDPRVAAFALSLRQIHCYSEHMVVYLQRNILEKSGVITKSQVSFNSGSKHDLSCLPLDKVTNSTHFVIATLYTMCGTVNMKTKQLLSYRNQVILKVYSLDNSESQNDPVELTDRNGGPVKPLLFTVTQDFYCTHDYQNTKSNVKHDYVSNEIFDDYSRSLNVDEDSVSSSKYTFRLQLYDNPWIGNPWMKYPKVVYEKQTIYAQLQLNQTVKDDDLRPLIKECYFSQKSNPTYEPRFNLINSGCPVANSALIHNRSPSSNQISRFTFVTSQYFENTYMFFHCKVTICSFVGNRENDGYENCPSSTACSEKGIISSHLRLVNSVNSYVSSGPIRPIMVEAIYPPTTCPPCPKYQTVEIAHTESHQMLNSQSQRQVVVTNGMNIYTVFGIAFASFLLGVALMGGLWKVHNLTEPKNFVGFHNRLHKRNNMNDFTSKENNYSLEPVISSMCTPMTESSVVSSKNFTPFKQ